jgi:hypothetical protein
LKKVLFIAYFFPPIGGAGVQRSLKFVKYLPVFGFMPTVLTAGAVSENRWSPKDKSLLREIPEEVRVHRVSDLPSTDTKRRWGRRLRDLLGRPTRFGAAWAASVLRDGARLCSEQRPDCILASMSPFEGAAPAGVLGQQFQIPFVADLRDPWALDEMQVYPSNLHRILIRQRMRRSLRAASAVIMNTPEAAAALSRNFPEFRRKRVVHITNGYDGEDFANLLPRRDPHIFRIVHTGSLHTEYGLRMARRRKLSRLLGGVSPGVDFLTRSHVFLLRALARWLPGLPGNGTRVRLTLAGVLTAEDRDAVAESPARDNVEMPGRLSHADTVQLQVDANLLFLPMHNLPPGQRATIVPGKTYDFLQAAGSGRFCRPDDVDGMVGVLAQAYEEWTQSGTRDCSDRDYVATFERKRLTERLASEMQRLCS